jgi:hypothetical protein
MNYNKLEGDQLQFVAERKELELYFDKVLRQIIKDEVPKLIQELGKKEWLTKIELEKLTGWSGRTIQHMRDTRQIPFSQHGRKILYPRDGILSFLEANYMRPKEDV